MGNAPDLLSDRLDTALEACYAVTWASTARIDEVLPRALKGQYDYAREYVAEWRHAAESILGSIVESSPDLVAKTADGFILVELKSSLPLMRVLDNAADDAPFTPWVTKYGLGKGTVAGLLAQIRLCLPQVSPLQPPENIGLPRHELGDEQFKRFSRAVHAAVDRVEDPLLRVKELFGLSNVELAQLFGVKRQAVEQWMMESTPSSRLTKLEAILRIGECLERKLKPKRLPMVARRKTANFGGRSILEMLQANREDELAESLQRSLEWARSA